jgi:hypothetical protein
MKSFYTKVSALLLVLSIGLSASYGQKVERIQTKIQDISISQVKGNTTPDISALEYRLVKMDVDAIKNGLKNVSYESMKKSGTVAQLEVPYPDGTIHTYEVVRNTTMHPELAARYPEIASFNAKGISHPEEYGKLDITPKGFHAMIFSPKQSTFFIDPFNASTTEDYIVYFKKNFETDRDFDCGVNFNSEDEVSQSSSAMPFGSCELRTYRLALACTGEYANFHGSNTTNNDKSFALAAQVTTMNRVNGIYEQTLAITMEIIPNNDLLIFLNPSTDPYTNNNGSTMLGQNQTTCDNNIGSANYDIGHVFSTGGGGIASLQSVCSSTRKAQGVTGSPTPRNDPFDVDYVSHEIGHQFGGNHTQSNSCQRNISTSMEPGSASTIMGYAGICSPNVQSRSDDHFHGVSIQEIGSFITSGGHNCPIKTTLVNVPPTIISTSPNNVIVPANTPFALTATATDVDGDALTYLWEQMDPQRSSSSYPMPPLSTSEGGPMFRSFSPSENPTRYFPSLQTLRQTGGSGTWEVLPSISRDLKFRLIVKDNHSVGSCNDHRDITVKVNDAAGPFVVIYPSDFGITWYRTTTETVIWDVAGTNVSPINCSTVNIYLSTDNGLTFPETLATNVPNTGSYALTVPSLPDLPTNRARIMVMCSDGRFFNVSKNSFTISQNTMSVSELKNSSFKVFPNPSKGNLNIMLSDLRATEISVVDVTGRVVLTDSMNEQMKTLDISNFTTGIYFIHLRNSEESRVIKIVKE